jgi:tight adherence protein C
MIWALTMVTFLATVAVFAALIYAFTPSEVRVAGRLSRLVRSSMTIEEDQSALQQKERMRNALASVGKLVPADANKKSYADLLIIRAGYRNPSAILALRGAKVLLPIALVIFVFASGLHRMNPFVFPVLAAVVGYLVPELWLVWRVHARQTLLRRALPDCLDLLVICVEAGLGLDQALLKVAEELRVSHPELTGELKLVNLEMRVGKSRMEALRELGRRTGLEDIKSLVAMLIQTERFGTSISQSLRVFSDDMRMRRRQRAEEMSAKTTVKMVPPLVFFIFPALMVVILGPAVITLVRQMMPVLSK